MKERPIPFSGPMVRAILEGRKTQTRRLVKMTERAAAALNGGCIPLVFNNLGHARWWSGGAHEAWNAWCHCGRPGDLLWVRERWATECDADDLSPRDLVARHEIEGWACPLWWHATDSGSEHDFHRGRWRAGMHLPRSLARLTLRVTSVRVERLQDITEEDARAEGLRPAVPSAPTLPMFERLWDQINGARAPWSSNPWVWVVGFERLEAAR